MKTLLLSAGQSKRVKPIEDKNFINFCGTSLIEHQLMRLKNAGFEDILLVGSANNIKELKKTAEKLSSLMTIQIIEQEDLNKGMAGALLSAEQHIGTQEELFIVSSNDFVEEYAYELMKKAFEKNKEADSFLLAKKIQEYFPGGYLSLNGTKIESIIEKPEKGKEPSNLINLVLHLHRQPLELIDLLKNLRSESDDLYEKAMDTLMKKNNFQAVEYNGYWQAVKYPWHVLDLMQYFLKNIDAKISQNAKIASTAIINGNVIIEDGVKIFDNAIINGPAYIGKNSVIANNALVRDSIVGENCVIGFGTELARSYVGDDCWFHSNYVGDSVLCDNISFGAGTVCANLRLDEKNIYSGEVDSGKTKLGAVLGSNIRIGVNCSVMPGIRIGKNTEIASHLLIAQDVPENSFVKNKNSIEILENKNQITGKRKAL